MRNEFKPSDPGSVARLTRALVGCALLGGLLAAVGARPATYTSDGLDLPRLMLWAWDRDDDLGFVDASDTGVAFLAATLTLRAEDVALTPRHNPLSVRPGVVRVAVVHVESDRSAPPTLSVGQLHRFVEALAAIRNELPQQLLQVDYEAPPSQRAFLLDAIAALQQHVPRSDISVTALASWCFNESWIGRLEADEVVPMLFRMGYDGRRIQARLANGADFRDRKCRTSLGIATDELPAKLPGGRRVYVFNPRRWTADTYKTVRGRIF